MKKLVFGLSVIISACVLADNVTTNTIAKKGRNLRAMFGGFVKDIRSQKGKVAIVDCQTAANIKWLEAAAAEFSERAMISVTVERGTFDFCKPELKGEVTVFVVDDQKLPMSLIAPEARWSVMNVAPLKTEKQAFFETRAMKALIRAIVPLLGGSDSQYPMCMMSNILKPEDYDKLPDALLQVDIMDRFTKNYPGLGIVPWKTCTYLQACKQGWAPAPTNDVQKAIWDKVHAIPAKPMKIEFDPKKGR